MALIHFIYQIYMLFQHKIDADTQKDHLAESTQNKLKLSLIVTGLLICFSVGMFLIAKKYSLFAKYYANI